MDRSTNYNFYLPTNADPMLISDIDYNFEVVDTEMAKAVKYTSQSLTAQQKGQARDNIGAAAESRTHFGTWSSVSLPFTADEDGFVYVYLNPSSASGAYARLSYTQGNFTNQVTLVAKDGNGVAAYAPIRKGCQLTQQQLTGGSLSAVRFMSVYS